MQHKIRSTCKEYKMIRDKNGLDIKPMLIWEDLLSDNDQSNRNDLFIIIKDNKF